MATLQHILARKPTGEVWAWGLNSSGALGDNSISNRSSPVSVVGSHSFDTIWSGLNYSLALKAPTGEVWAWGLGTTGELGDNTATSKSSPVSVVGSHSFVKVVGASVSAHGLKADNGTVWSWGGNGVGELGDNTGTSKSSPISAAGANFAAGLKADGTVWCWGNGGQGQLGNNIPSGFLSANRSSPVSVLGNHSFVKIMATNSSCFGLKITGEVWAWGSKTSGLIGNNESDFALSLVQTVGGHNFYLVSGGNSGLLALKLADGSAWHWGRSQQGEGGDGTVENRFQ